MKMLTVSLLVCGVMALTTAAAEPACCPHGWTHHNRRCFLYVPSEMTWANAEKNCQNQGGNLASVHNLDEYRVIQSVIQKFTQSYPLTWLGGSDAQQEGTWFWIDGTPFGFDYWAPGQPDNWLSLQHCLVMNFGDQNKFDDDFCVMRKPSVCARKP